MGSHPLTVWLKYIGQALETWRILGAERPRAVFVMTPPLFAGLVAWAHCRMRGGVFVVDAHTAAFLHPRWRYLQALQFWICRRAATTLVTNEYLRGLVERRGAHATIVPDVPVQFEAGAAYELTGGFKVVVVSSFNPDEPVREIVDAAKALEEVSFFLTGNPKSLPAQLARDLPQNVRLTGFLSASAYGSVLTSADAVMTLTTRDHTMLRGAWESVYAGTPVIVSDWPILREAFDEGAVHVDSTPEGIAAGVEEMRRNIKAYRHGILALRARKRERWLATRERILARLCLP